MTRTLINDLRKWVIECCSLIAQKWVSCVRSKGISFCILAPVLHIDIRCVGGRGVCVCVSESFEAFLSMCVWGQIHHIVIRTYLSMKYYAWLCCCYLAKELDGHVYLPFKSSNEKHWSLFVWIQDHSFPYYKLNIKPFEIPVKKDAAKVYSIFFSCEKKNEVNWLSCVKVKAFEQRLLWWTCPFTFWWESKINTCKWHTGLFTKVARNIGYKQSDNFCEIFLHSVFGVLFQTLHTFFTDRYYEWSAFCKSSWFTHKQVWFTYMCVWVHAHVLKAG